MHRVFDCHLHLLQKASLTQSVESYRRYFTLNHVERAIFLMIPWEVAWQTNNDDTQNLKGLYLKKQFPNCYSYAGLCHYPTLSEEEQAENFLAQAQEYYAAGYDGIKLLEGKPGLRKLFKFKISDPVYDKMFSFLEEVNMPVTLHNGDPSAFWDKSKMSEYAIKRGWFVDETNLTLTEMQEDILTLMKRHPKLRFTQAHCGFTSDRIEQAKRFLGDYEYTRYDMTPGGEQELYMSRHWDTWGLFFAESADRYKYGTDTYNSVPPETPLAIPPRTVEPNHMPGFDIDPEKVDGWTRNLLYRPWFLRNFMETATEHVYSGETFKGVHLPCDVREKIYFGNAYRDLGDPRPVNEQYYAAELDKLTAKYKATEDIPAYLAQYKLDALSPDVLGDLAEMGK